MKINNRFYRRALPLSSALFLFWKANGKRFYFQNKKIPLSKRKRIKKETLERVNS